MSAALPAEGARQRRMRVGLGRRDHPSLVSELQRRASPLEVWGPFHIGWRRCGPEWLLLLDDALRPVDSYDLDETGAGVRCPPCPTPLGAISPSLLSNGSAPHAGVPRLQRRAWHSGAARRWGPRRANSTLLNNGGTWQVEQNALVAMLREVA